MFDIGFWELTLIGLLALIVLGPKRLPEAARAAGRWLASLRRFVENVKHDFDRELNTAELAELRKLREELKETRQTFEQSSTQIIGAVDEEINKAASLADSGGRPKKGAAAAKRVKKSKPQSPSRRRTKRTRRSSAMKSHARAKKA